MKQLIPKNNYEVYLKRQWKEVDRPYELKLFSKHIDIISKVKIDIDSNDVRILCIGSRYGIEVEAFKQLGYTNIKAIDIYPRSKLVMKADMHELPFSNDSFDFIYTHHSLDHALYPNKAIDEMYRVSINNAIWTHTIPFDDYGKEEAIDFDSSKEIVDFFEKYTKEILYEQEVKRLKNGNIEPIGFYLPEGWINELRLIIKISK